MTDPIPIPDPLAALLADTPDPFTNPLAELLATTSEHDAEMGAVIAAGPPGDRALQELLTAGWPGADSDILGAPPVSPGDTAPARANAGRDSGEAPEGSTGSQ